MKTSTISLRSTKFVATAPQPSDRGEALATERQECVPGFSQSICGALRIVLIGAGGIGGEISTSLVRKGIGHLEIFDDDVVELSNLNRQRFFPEDLYKNKAERLAGNLTREATGKSVIVAYPHRFQDAVGVGLDLRADVAICGIDNNEGRVAVAQYFLNTAPVVFIGVSEDADHGYVFVQEPGRACFGCLFPQAVEDKTQHPCSPAVIDILKVVAGVATYAVDSLVMSRKRCWNYKEVFLSGSLPERNATIEARESCPICRPRR